MARIARLLAEVLLAVFYTLGWIAALVVIAAVTVASAVRLGWKDAVTRIDRKRQEATDGTA